MLPAVSARVAVPSDAAGIANVIVAAQSAWDTGDFPDYIPYVTAELEQAWRVKLRQPHVHRTFVATDLTGDVTGVVSHLPEHLSHSPSPVTAGSAHLSTLFVSATQQGTLTAQHLHDTAIASMITDRFRTARLFVPQVASRAQSFYRRNGWEPTGREIVFAGLNRLEMRKALV